MQRQSSLALEQASTYGLQFKTYSLLLFPLAGSNKRLRAHGWRQFWDTTFAPLVNELGNIQHLSAGDCGLRRPHHTVLESLGKQRNSSVEPCQEVQVISNKMPPTSVLFCHVFFC